MATHSSSPFYSIGSSRRGNHFRSFSEDPGPGAYDLEFKKDEAPRWKIGTSLRSQITKSTTPGPGTYKNHRMDRKIAPRCVIGKSEVSNEPNSNYITPGPGTYNIENVSFDLRQPPAFTMPARRIKGEFDVITDGPGPGSYEQNSSVLNHSPPAFRIGNSQRGLFGSTTDTPGPGSYEIRNEKIPGPKAIIGTALRIKNTEDEEGLSPGPGAYDHPSSLNTSENRGIKLSSRHKALSFDRCSPGPAAYDPSPYYSSIKPKKTSVRIGSELRATFKTNSWTPGPADYDPKTMTHKAAPSYKIGSAKRRPLNEGLETPGPGTYSKLNDSNMSTCSMGGRHEDKSRLVESMNMPGPSDYTPSIKQTKKTEPSMPIGYEKRKLFSKFADIPGPGLYDLKGNLQGPQWKIGTEPRRTISKKGIDPGPGSYDIQPLMGNAPNYKLIKSIPRKNL